MQGSDTGFRVCRVLGVGLLIQGLGHTGFKVQGF